MWAGMTETHLSATDLIFASTRILSIRLKLMYASTMMYFDIYVSNSTIYICMEGFGSRVTSLR